MKRCSAAVMVSMLCAAPVFAQDVDTAPDVEELVASVQTSVDNLATLQCFYEQLYYRAVDGQNIIRRGTLVLADSSRFRLEDATKAVVGDGASVWLYVAANEQVTVSEFIGDDETFMTPQSLFLRYTETRDARYDGAESIDGRMLDRLTLPAVNPGDADVTVWIDREYAFPVMTLEEYPGGDTNRYILRDLRLNEPVADSTFVFIPPDGVEIIDMRDTDE